MSTITLPEPRIEPPASIPTTAGPPSTTRLRRLLLGRAEDAKWVRPSLLGLLAATAVLYLWGLGGSGWANSFYSAAVEAGTHSWKAFFYGSSDASNFITVDKPPASLWVMELSARLFGVNAWSILVPQALEGVAAVGFLYAAVRRWFTPAAGLLAGAILAVTPVAALMFRFNNPDALLVLLLTIGAYALVRAVESGRTGWLVLASSLVGFGFLTKMLQALVVVPAFGLVYLVAGQPKLLRRIGQLLWAALALLVSAGWWVAIVELTPASARPYIGGSQNNSVLNLIFGYNGLGRITGNETGSVGGAGGGTGMWGATGWLRMFNTEFGGQASWLLPAALILLAAGLAVTWRAARTDRLRAALMLWGGWLLVTGVIFSLSEGIIHPYYTVALAPAIGAIVGIGATHFWAKRATFGYRAVLSATVAVTTWWAVELLNRSPDWNAWLRPTVIFLGGVAALALLWPRLRGVVAAAVATAAIVAGLAAPTAASIATAASTHTGAIPSASPIVAGGGFGGGPVGARGAGGFGGRPPTGAQAPTGGFGGQATGQATTGQAPTRTGGGGGVGGLLNSSTPSTEVIAALDADAGSYTWVAATIGANQAAGYQLASDDPVMAIGGFNGTDPTPSLAQFQQYVADGDIHYFIAGGQGGGGGGANGSGTSAQITAWVTSTFTATTVGGVTLYDLTATGTAG